MCSQVMFNHLHPPASSDYTTVSMNLTFNSSTTTRTVMIPITGDTVVEEVTESFTVSLSYTAGDSAVMLSPPSTIVTIQDDDCKLWCMGESSEDCCRAQRSGARLGNRDIAPVACCSLGPENVKCMSWF